MLPTVKTYLPTVAHFRRLCSTLLGGCLLLVAVCAAPTVPSAFAQTLYVPNFSGNTVTAYSATTGTALPGFTAPSGLGSPNSTAVLGNTLYVAASNNTISTFNATTGAAVSTGFISPAGLDTPTGLAIRNDTLYVASYYSNTLGAYNLATGAALPGFTSPGNLNNPYDVLYVPAVPEPGNWTLLIVGTIALTLAARRRLPLTPSA